jgi:hypothetical protein
MAYKSRYDWTGAKVRRRNQIRTITGILLAVTTVGAAVLVGSLLQ